MNINKNRAYAASFVGVFLIYALIEILFQLNIFNRYIMSVLRLVTINVILAVSLNITVGNLGQINLGHAGFMSIGAYSFSLFLKSGLIPGMAGYFTALLIAGFSAYIVSFLIGLPALRLKGDYLAIVTLAFGEIIRVLIESFEFTGGAQGLSGIPKMQNFTIMYFIAALSVSLMYSVMTSRHGRAVLAIREDEIAAEASGIDVTKYKTFAFTLSAFFAGIAGGMYAANIGVIGARVFDYNRSFDILVMVVLGGLGSFTGAILSSTVLTIIPEMLRQFSDYRMIVYALVLIMMMIFRPVGLLGREEFSINSLLNFLKRKFERSSKNE
ncbi:MAG: branched-chain amino acid ABC transporter permease [Tissierellia bacterium]|nr:branched-chain amino acid ABC transporter permease [Tissierellia bacterium]